MHHENILISLPDVSLALLGQIAVCGVILALTCTYFRRRASTIPSIKVGHFSIFGIDAAFPSRATKKKLPFPDGVYLLQACAGLANLFSEEKIYGTSGPLFDLVFLTKAESMEEFFTSNIASNKPFRHILAPYFGTGIFLSIGEKWKSRRKALSSLFHYDIIKQCIPVFERQSRAFVEIFKCQQAEKGIDVKHPTAICTMNIICESFLDINAEAQENSRFERAMLRAVRTIANRTLTPLDHVETLFKMTESGKQFKKDIDYVRSYSEKIIKEKKVEERGKNKLMDENKSRKPDLFKRIFEYQKRKPEVRDEDMRDELLSFILAGVDTTAVALAWTIYLIGLYPEVQRKIFKELQDTFGDDTNKPITEGNLKELSYLECVVRESQRLYPSVPLNIKEILEDTVLCGFKIKKGTVAVLNYYSLHRDPKVFPNPEVFDPDRFLPVNSEGRHPYAYIPFSAGERNCLGRRFAIMEIKTVVANVLRNFSLHSMEHRDKICPASEITLRPAQELKVAFIPRNYCTNI